MSFNIHVEGGNNKRKKLASGPPEQWYCLCKQSFVGALAPPNEPVETLKLNRSYLAACPDCHMRRPS